MSMHDIDTKTETRIAILEKDFSNVSGLFGRLDNALERLTDISNSIRQLLAVHDARLDHQEKMDEKLLHMIEERRNITDKQYESLHKRIGEVKDELEQEIDDRNEKLEGMIKELKDSQDEHHKVMVEKVSSIERWKWAIVGGAVAIGFLIAEMDFFVRMFG